MDTDLTAINNRQLAAILFADIVDITIRMQKEEAIAISILNRFEAVLKEVVEKHKGEIIKTYGNGGLLLFPSCVNAILCAKEMQIAFRASPKVPLRIGIHIDEVIRSEKDIFGNGVNIASRMESLGIVGSVLFSQDVAKRIKNHPSIKTISLGIFNLKNVEEPIEVFALANEGFQIPTLAELQKEGYKSPRAKKNYLQWIGSTLGLMALLCIAFFLFKAPLTILTTPPHIADKSIAVLPFDNFTDNPEQQYVSDGISQDILTHLSRIKDLQVISFNSSQQYRTSDKTNKEIGMALGVQHLLKGNIQQIGNQFRIRAMLINTLTEEQLWANNFDGQLEDIFQVQSEVSSEIAKILKAELLPAVAARINAKPTENLEAWQEYSQGKQLWRKRGIENLFAAEKHFLQAIAIDPKFALAYTGLAQTYAVMGIEDHQYIEKSKTLAEQAIALNPTMAEAYSTLGYYYRIKSDYSKVVPNFEKALELEPGNATTHQWYAEALFSKGDIAKGRTHIEVAKKLDPKSKIIQIMSAVYLFTEDNYDAAKMQLEAFFQQSPNIPPIAYFLGAYYVKVGDYQKMKNMPTKHLMISEEEKQLIYFRSQQQLSELKKLKTHTLQAKNIRDKNAVLYKIENEILLLSGHTERYISRLDSSVFILGYETIDELQCFPPPDSIRLHPKFQEMLQERGISMRPRSVKIKG